MKQFFIMLTVAIALCACNKEKEEGKDITLIGGTQTTQTVYADQIIKSDGIKFNAVAPWTATVSAIAANRAGGSQVEWLQLNVYEGKAGDHTLTLTLKPNTTGADRRAEIRIVCGTFTITIIVEQKGTTQSGEKPEPEPISYFITSDGKITGGEILGNEPPSELSAITARMDDGDRIDVSQDKVPYANKNFNMTFPTPSADMLGAFHSPVAIEKPNVLPADVQFSGGAVGYKMANTQMSLELTNISLENIKKGGEYLMKKGEGYITFVYATKASTINGTLKYNGDPKIFKFSNCKLRQGWNEIAMIAETNMNADYAVTINATTNNATSDFKWIEYEVPTDYFGSLVTSIIYGNGSDATNFTYNNEYRVSSISEYDQIYHYTHFSDQIVSILEKEEGDTPEKITLKLSDAGQIVSADSPTMQRRFVYTNNMKLAQETYTPINSSNPKSDYTIYDWQTPGKVTAVTFLANTETTTSVYEFHRTSLSHSNLNLFSLLSDAGSDPISMIGQYYGGLDQGMLITKITTTGDKWNKDNGVVTFSYIIDQDKQRIEKIYTRRTPAWWCYAAGISEIHY